MRILLVEDEPRIAADVATTLEADGYVVEMAPDGEDAWFRGDTEDFDLIVLDLGLPKIDGLAVLKLWRAADRHVPVLVLTARGAWAQRVEGIGAGADDYQEARQDRRHRTPRHGRRSGMVNRHRGIGWEYLHVAVDDASRLAYTEILPDERKPSATVFLERALAWFARHGVTVERIITDNGNAYRSHDFRDAWTSAGVRHLRTRPYTPRTNGKAEAFLQTDMR